LYFGVFLLRRDQDWYQDAFRERHRKKFEFRYDSSSKPIKSIIDLYGSAQSWLVVGLVGKYSEERPTQKKKDKIV
jgi:hypothetical protein